MCVLCATYHRKERKGMETVMSKECFCAIALLLIVVVDVDILDVCDRLYIRASRQCIFIGFLSHTIAGCLLFIRTSIVL